MRRTLLTLVMTALAGQLAGAEPAEKAEAPEQFLASRFESRSAGISLRPPVGGTKIKPAVIGTNVVQFSNSDDRWSLIVNQLVFEKPAMLVGKDNPATPDEDESRTHVGILRETAQRIVTQNASTEILREDLINVGRHDAGILVLRWTEGAQTWLRQIALIQRHDRHFYSLDFRTPSGRTPADKEDEEDFAETKAVEIFNGVLDSVVLLDQLGIEYDRDERLIRTRGLFLQFPTKIPRVLESEQYFRVLREGKDVGWMYVVEEAGQRNGMDGFYVASLSHLTGADNRKFDVASEAFCAKDRKNEAWVTITVVSSADGSKTHYSEFGQADPRMVRAQGEERRLDPGDPRNAAPPKQERQMLTVTQTSKAGAGEPILRELPPYYLPQALGTILPRLVPTNETKGYLFVTWVPSEKGLVFRYIDTERERNHSIGGKAIVAARIVDRLGLEGDQTYHYVADGKYLGNETPTTGVSIVATDQQAFSRLWPEAKVGRPRVLDAPGDGPREK